MTPEPTDPEPDNEIETLPDSISEALRDLEVNASVAKAYGDPIESAGKTIIPVARVAYGFGAGSGTGPEMPDGDGAGTGGGGGAMTHPIGVLEVSEEETRFVRFTNYTQLGLAVGIGLLLGLLVGRR